MRGSKKMLKPVVSCLCARVCSCIWGWVVADPSRLHSTAVLLLSQEFRRIVIALTSARWSGHPCSSPRWLGGRSGGIRQLMGLGQDDEQGHPGIWQWLGEHQDPWTGCINRRREASLEVGGLAPRRGLQGHIWSPARPQAPLPATET